MRIIAGKFRGMRFDAPDVPVTRPMTDRIKETIFNILGHRFGLPGWLPEFDVMDVFAGSGALGIEALSRGARSCVFVERDRRVLGTLRANLEMLRGRTEFRIRTENAWTMRYLPPVAATDGPGELPSLPTTQTPAPTEENSERGYGIIFMDPPYADTGDDLRLIDMMERAAPALRPEGVIVFRFRGKTDAWDVTYPSLEYVDRRDFGNMRMVLLQRREFAKPMESQAAPAVEPD